MLHISNGGKGAERQVAELLGPHLYPWRRELPVPGQGHPSGRPQSEPNSLLTSYGALGVAGNAQLQRPAHGMGGKP